MDEGRCDQHTGTKVLRGEEDWRGNLQPLDLLRNHGEATT